MFMQSAKIPGVLAVRCRGLGGVKVIHSHLVDSVYGVGFIFGQFVCNLMSILFANIWSFSVMSIYHVLTIGFCVLRYMCRLGCIVVV